MKIKKHLLLKIEDFWNKGEVVGEVSFYCARGKPHCGSKSMDQMRKEVASFKVIVNFKL